MMTSYGSFTMPLGQIFVTSSHTKTSMAKGAAFKMHGLDNSHGCAILKHAMVGSVSIVFFLLRIGPLSVSL